MLEGDASQKFIEGSGYVEGIGEVFILEDKQLVGGIVDKFAGKGS